MEIIEKTYIGHVEAYELAYERGITRLPRKGRQILSVYSVQENISGRNNTALGRDEDGYYTANVNL